MSADRLCAQIVELVNQLNALSKDYNSPDDMVASIQSRIAVLTSTMVDINRENAYYERIEQHGFRGVGIITGPKVKTISREKLEEVCPSECSVCFEEVQFKNAVVTNCGHYYCKGCWNTWMNAAGTNKCCPTCRAHEPMVTTFR